MDPLLLYIETSEQICSVCLAKGEVVIAHKISETLNGHASLAAVFVEAILKENNFQTKDLSTVVLSAGPGSYTGLRIGASLAKGICYAANIPLIAVSTLKAMVAGIATQQPNKLLCPMIDARRMEVYTAIFDAELNILAKEQPLVLSEETATIFDFEKTIFFGSGAEKILQVNLNANIIKDFKQNATHLITEGLAAYNRKEFADLAYFEPNYIKPFYSTAKTV
jgi:tRNA threonylcarbamoyladenosine biosynthesis protein TsaB